MDGRTAALIDGDCESKNKAGDAAQRATNYGCQREDVTNLRRDGQRSFSKDAPKKMKSFFFVKKVYTCFRWHDSPF